MKHRIGLVVGTNGTPPYVAMQIKSRLLFEDHIPMLIHDDHSPQMNEVQAMAKSAGVDFDSSASHLGHVRGDLACFRNGLIWADSMGIEFLVKMSRRYVPILPWSEDLEKIIDKSSRTFSSIHKVFNMDFSTHLMAMRVKDWRFMVPEIERAIAREKMVSVEWFMYRLAVKIDPFREMACQQWSLTEELERHERRALWRDKNTVLDYVNMAASWGLNYPTYQMVI